MKTILVVFLMLFAATTASADYYVINKDNRAIARCAYPPDEKDLNSRQEFFVYSQEDHAIQDLEYVGGKLGKRAKSQKEKNDEEALALEKSEMAVVYHTMFREAYKAAVADGHKFDNLAKHVDNAKDVEASVKERKENESAAIQKLKALGLTDAEVKAIGL